MCLIFGAIIKHHCSESKRILKDIFYYGVHSGNKFFNYALVTNEEFLSSPNVDHVNTNTIINHIPDNSIFLCYCIDSYHERIKQPLIQGDTCFIYTGKFGTGDITDLQKKFSIILRTENAGEIFLTKLLDGTHLSILQYSDVQLFCIWSKNNTIYTLRNDKQPGYFMEKHGNIYLSSENKIKSDHNSYETDFELIPANELYTIGRIQY